jgi:hypothetical protein
MEARRSPPAKSAGPGTTESSLALTNLMAWHVSFSVLKGPQKAYSVTEVTQVSEQLVVVGSNKV